MNRAYFFMSAAILTPTSAFADTNAAENAEATSSAEITVTGLRQKFRGTLAADDIPQAIQEVPRELIDQQGITELTDALILAPGFSRQNNYGGAYDAYAVRGFVGNPNVPSPYLINGYSARGFGGIGDRKAQVGFGVNYVGKRRGEAAFDFSLPAYTLVKLNGSVEVNQNFVVSATVSNLFNERHYLNSFSRLWINPGPPREFSIRAAYSF